MKKTGRMIGLVMALLGTFFLAGCGGSSADREVLTVSNWGDYIDPQVIEDFEAEYGVDVIYEEFATNEEMYVKIKAGASNYDIAIPSDYMIQKMAKEDLLLPLNFDNIPNYELIGSQYKNLEFDPENTYSVPYMWGTVGIAYNTTMVDDPIDSWDILWNDKYAKSIYMLNSQRDTMMVAQKRLGFSMNTKDEQELEQVKQMLVEQKPLVASYVGDEVKDLMIAGNAALAVVWSGDVVEMMWENPDIAFALPKEGTNQWVDSMVIPTTSQHKELAEKFINFMCSTEVALMNAEYIGYNTPQMEALEMLPEELTTNPDIYPDASTLENGNFEVFVDLDDALPLYDRIWTEILAE